jgi:hypothetical protein
MEKSSGLTKYMNEPVGNVVKPKRNNTPWEPDEVKEWLMYNKDFSKQEIGDAIGRSKYAVATRMSKEGLFFHPPYYKIPKSLQLEVAEILGAEGK